MLLPDFRSAERTFQLLTQVAGRAGRSTLAGEVIIQTYQSDHYTLKHVTTHDYRGFYEEEIAQRREIDYPPFSRIVLIEFRGKEEEETMRHAEAFGRSVRRHAGGLLTLGPAPAAVSRLKGLFRWHLVVKSPKTADPSGHALHAAMRSALASYQSSPLGRARSVRIVVDVDPVSMM
jgi:primosomal protein N' (replication factor Y)